MTLLSSVTIVNNRNYAYLEDGSLRWGQIGAWSFQSLRRLNVKAAPNYLINLMAVNGFEGIVNVFALPSKNSPTWQINLIANTGEQYNIALAHDELTPAKVKSLCA